MIERGLRGRHAVAHGHIDGGADGNAAAAVLDQLPSLIVDAKAMDVLVARFQETGAAQGKNLSAQIGADEMLYDRHAGFPAGAVDLWRQIAGECEREQLILGAEIGALDPADVLGVARARASTAGVGVDGADAGILERLDAGVAVLWRVRDLRKIDDGRRAHLDEAETRDKHSRIGI